MCIRDSRSSYEIHYPFTGDQNADKSIKKIVSGIEHEFDSLFVIVAANYHEEEPFGRTAEMTAWFEPSFVSKHWLCGHFIIHYEGKDISRILAFNYNYVWNKNINVEDLIISKDPQGIEWKEIISAQKNISAKDKVTQADWDLSLIHI